MASHERRPRLATVGAVALGGIFGALARVFLPWPTLLDEHFAVIDPLPLVIINLGGAALLGFVSGYTTLRPWPEPLLKGVTTGLLGSFTTMSALALVVTACTVGRGVLGEETLSLSLLYAAAAVVVLVIFLWMTTLLTLATYRIGVRVAGHAS